MPLGLGVKENQLFKNPKIRVATRNKCVRKEQMKRADIRAKFQEAGLEAEKIDEIVNYIMDVNGKDVNLAKNTADEEFAKLKAENEALLKDKTELSAKIDTYKDYDLLKQFKADSDAKAEKQQKADYLKSIGCKHPDLFENQIDWSKASYDQEKKTYTGLDEVVKGLKESYKDMFESKDNPAPEKTIGTIDFGNVKTQNPEANKPLNLADAINDHYKK